MNSLTLTNFSHDASNRWNYHDLDLAILAARALAVRPPKSTPIAARFAKDQHPKTPDADFQKHWQARIFYELPFRRDPACHSRETPSGIECREPCHAHPTGSTRQSHRRPACAFSPIRSRLICTRAAALPPVRAERVGPWMRHGPTPPGLSARNTAPHTHPRAHPCPKG